MIPAEPHCPHCSSLRLETLVETLEVVCTDCGHVITQRLLRDDDAFTGMGTARLADGTVHTVIAPIGLRGGRKITARGSGADPGKYKRMQKCRISKHLNELGVRFHLDPTHISECRYRFQQCIDGNLGAAGGRRADILAGAVIYIKIRETTCATNLLEVASAVHCNIYEVGRMYKEVKRFLQLSIPEVDPFVYLQRMTIDSYSELGLPPPALGETPETVHRPLLSLSAKILAIGKTAALDQGRKPEPLAAAAIVIATNALMRDNARHVKQIERMAKIHVLSKTTIKQRYVELNKIMVLHAVKLPWAKNVHVRNVGPYLADVIKWWEALQRESDGDSVLGALEDQSYKEDDDCEMEHEGDVDESYEGEESQSEESQNEAEISRTTGIGIVLESGANTQRQRQIHDETDQLKPLAGGRPSIPRTPRKLRAPRKRRGSMSSESSGYWPTPADVNPLDPPSFVRSRQSESARLAKIQFAKDRIRSTLFPGSPSEYGDAGPLATSADEETLFIQTLLLCGAKEKDLVGIDVIQLEEMVNRRTREAGTGIPLMEVASRPREELDRPQLDERDMSEEEFETYIVPPWELPLKRASHDKIFNSVKPKPAAKRRVSTHKNQKRLRFKSSQPGGLEDDGNETPEIRRKHQKLIKTADELDYDTALSGSEREMEKTPRETMAGADEDRVIGAAGTINGIVDGRNAAELGNALIEETEMNRLSLTYPIGDGGDVNGDVMMMTTDREDGNSIEVLSADGNTKERSPVKPEIKESGQPPRGRPKMAFKPTIERAKLRCRGKNKDDSAADDSAGSTKANTKAATDHGKVRGQRNAGSSLSLTL